MRETPINTSIYGSLKGLKSSQLKQLQRLYQQSVPSDRLTTPELAQRIAALSTDLNQSVCVYLNRRGKVIRVGVGSPRQTQIPAIELPRYGAERLSGIRCLAATPKDVPPKESSLTAMVLQRLDALVTFTLTQTGTTKRGRGATGYVKNGYVAHLLPQTHPSHEYWEVSDAEPLEAIAEQDFLDLVEGLEEEFRREFTAQKVDQTHDRVILVGLQTDGIKDQRFTDGLTELARLVDTAGGEVLLTMEQRRSHPHPQTLVGSGKVDDIALQIQTLGASLVVFDQDLSPAQSRNLERKFGVKVCDRTEVILDIFAQRAQSRAGKLQVELAQLEYMLPRLTGRGQAMSRLGGGIGTRGPGETKLETERRTIQNRLSRLQKEVDQLQAHRSRMRNQRQRQDVPTFSIVGYTNAGKSTLINALTNAEVYAADQLFATLDPTTRRLTLTDDDHQARTILLTDTVGFIHELPPALVDAFRATLEEVTEADALIHVIDLSHPAWQHQLHSVEKILEEMPIMPAQALLVFNKLDQVPSEALDTAKTLYPHAIFISAGDRLGFETLRQRLTQMLKHL
ncbi:GTP-binding protein HflX [[Leptolyngbya] sp. PCC 7376]|uniref:GTPase HflX n=1 Tax=[Leptolyngbya] sp. PCC 7376 TaxID=111781 RepID=UPI00029F2482|nr:GTPase HflX [[Leptolyngbya] sp. PCC 7376]AFY37924.1 GTP-binding protein HflX [[Leptolyngbya] sp. PCC 7376]